MSEKTLEMERVFAAPRDLVWRAWTEPALFAKWYGPKGCEVTFSEFDLRPGGVSRHAMNFASGAMHGKLEFVEVVEPERLVFRQMMCDADGNPIRNPQMPWPLKLMSTVTLHDRGEETLMRFEWAPIDATEEELASFMAAVEKNQSGWGMGFDNMRELVEGERPSVDWRVAGFLHVEKQGDRALHLQRRFEAALDAVYRAFTEPELIEQWMLGPGDKWSLQCELDVRPGGAGRYEWSGSGGEKMVMTLEYDEVEPGRRIVHREQFDDDWTAGETTIVTEFSEVEGGTEVVMTITYASAEARQNVFDSSAWWGMETGYGKLDELLG